VALGSPQALKLARRLRELRESIWPDQELTQAQLAKALSSEGRVGPATLSSWESTTSPKTPSAARLTAYARFFCTERSLEGEPHLLPHDQLSGDELDRFQRLESKLLKLLNHEDCEVRRSFKFDAGPVRLICPDVPTNVRGPLAYEKNANFTKMQQYGDLDALIELYGHLRAENPTLDVLHRLASEAVSSDDLFSHVILLGGIGWNRMTRRIQSKISQVPITQTEVEDLKDGDIFQVETPDTSEPKLFYPEYENLGDGKELIADVAYLARLNNPFRANRTLTICNGIFSYGVLGAIRCLTDPRVREENEKYLAERFPDSEFAMLLRVRVADNRIAPPDLQDPDVRLYEWAPNKRAPQVSGEAAVGQLADQKGRQWF
jgi:transcriptional regulator with XRE-family HTH domain